MPGRNQRLKRHQEQVASGSGGGGQASQGQATQGSFLINMLLYDMVWGHLSAHAVQRYADAALRDGLDHPDVRKVAFAGSRGRWKNNIRTQLLNMLQPGPLQGAIALAKIPLKHLRLGMLMLSQPIIMPHIFLAVMYSHYRWAFDKYILGSTATLQQWWQDMRGNPQYERHPIRGRDDRMKGIPIATHGDGLPCLGIGHVWQKSFDVFSWCSLTGQGVNTLLMNWLVWCFPKSMTCKTHSADTRKKLFQILCWSLLAAWYGEWPARDWNGV